MATVVPSCTIYTDSDDLKQLTGLLESVVESDVIIVLQTSGLLTRPWCLLEIYHAAIHGVPLIAVNLVGCGGGKQFVLVLVI